jgi:aconitate hydratase
MQLKDSYQTKSTLSASGKSYTFFSLRKLENSFPNSLNRLPISLRILLENLLRQEDGRVVRREDIEALIRWDAKATPDKEIAFMPARVLLQDRRPCRHAGRHC